MHQITTHIVGCCGVDGDGRTGQVRHVARRVHIQQAGHIGSIVQGVVFRNLDRPVARIVRYGGVGHAVESHDHDRAGRIDFTDD